MIRAYGKHCRGAWLLTAALLICLMVPALGESVMVTGEDEKEALQIQVVPDEVIEIDEYDVPYGLPEDPACWTHYILLTAALGMGIAYTVVLRQQKKKVRSLEQQLKEANHA